MTATQEFPRVTQYGPKDWSVGMGDGLFASPNPTRIDAFGAIWDMVIDQLSRRSPDDFERMYDSDRGYPLLDVVSIELWERYTDELVRSPAALARSLDGWLDRQELDVAARWICQRATDRAPVPPQRLREVRQTPPSDFSMLARIEEATLAELRALSVAGNERTRMEAFVPVAERMIELHRQMTAAAAGGEFARLERMVGDQVALTRRLNAVLL